MNGDLPLISLIGRVETPSRCHVKHHEADALVFFCREVGSHQAEHPVGQIAVGGPDLGTVDDEVITHVVGAHLQAGQIGTRIGFAVALGPADFTAGDRRQVLLFEFLAAKFQ